MFLNNLIQIASKSNNPHSLFLRTQIKEAIQDYVLNFFYNHHDYKNLVFTGGTCLRKVFGLNRLSEDLDFDIYQPISMPDLASDLIEYFQSNLKYSQVDTKISSNNQTILIKFPKLAEQLKIVQNKSDSSLIFLRCDITSNIANETKTEISSISITEFSFFVRNYDLPTLFSHKIDAFLSREFFKGKLQQTPFKSRDLYDLVWFLEKAKKSNLSPNWPRLFILKGTNDKTQIITNIRDKVAIISPSDVSYDLEPFIESENIRQNFSQNFKTLINSGLQYL